MKEDYVPAVTLTKVIQDPLAKDLAKRARLVTKLGPAKNLAKYKAKEATYSKQVEKTNLTRDIAGMLVSPSPKCCRIQAPLLHSGLFSLSGSSNPPQGFNFMMTLTWGIFKSLPPTPPMDQPPQGPRPPSFLQKMM